ncbi:hypothetical protein HDA32_003171 [Spinactinospora alkalitolerans]|uniref:Uncharacterized protein n=1 Tax=Spinactinospora alkalitolerans TaxID=687207 RepID=A0A852TWE5_9ACTN|nr:hypothetical protein [Spinactinospora alkalitolerans]NYE48051.1 hypothetical protein [Spinactinospora alkalitolerans]
MVGATGWALISAGWEAREARAAEEAEAAAYGSTFEDAVDECGLGYSSGADIGDEGASLVIDHRGQDETGGLSYAQLDCVTNAVDAPDHVTAHMENTTAMDGRQSASWDGITASWSYHPDRGLDIVFSLDRDR